MRRLDLEELQSNLFCLKKQLVAALDENQVLKVKIRRLEDEIHRKDRYIDCLRSDYSQDDETFIYEGRSSLISKLKKRNEELENMLLEREWQEEKRMRDSKIMYLYSHNADYRYQVNKKDSSKSSLQAGSHLKPHVRNSNSSSSTSLNKVKTSVKRGRMRSTEALQAANSPRETNSSCYSPRSTGDCINVQQDREKEEVCNVLNSLELERIVAKRLSQMKNSEISQFSADLRDIKNLLKKQEHGRITRSTSTTQIWTKSPRFDAAPLALSRAKSTKAKKLENYRPAVKFGSKKLSRGAIELGTKSEQKKLATLHEHSDETSLSSATNSNKPKTRIEYIFDSEVSSDGEEYSVQYNLANIFNETVNATSSENLTDLTSD